MSDLLQKISDWQGRRSVEEVFERGYSASEKPTEADTAMFVAAELFAECKKEIERLTTAADALEAKDQRIAEQEQEIERLNAICEYADHRRHCQTSIKGITHCDCGYDATIAHFKPADNSTLDPDGDKLEAAGYVRKVHDPDRHTYEMPESVAETLDAALRDSVTIVDHDPDCALFNEELGHYCDCSRRGK